MSVLPGSMDVNIIHRILVCIGGKETPGISMFGKFIFRVLDVSLIRVILRFTSVDVSIAMGILLFIRRESLACNTDRGYP